MDVLLHRYGGHERLRVPDGLPQLVHDISREVLRRQPTQLYCFIADYLDSVIATQEASKAIRDMMSDFFVELGSGETGHVGNGPGGETALQEAGGPALEEQEEPLAIPEMKAAITSPSMSQSEPKLRSALTTRPEAHGRGSPTKWPTTVANLGPSGSANDDEAASAPPASIATTDALAHQATSREFEREGGEGGVGGEGREGAVPRALVDSRTPSNERPSHRLDMYLNMLEIEDMNAQIRGMMAVDDLRYAALPPCLALTEAMTDTDDLFDLGDDADSGSEGSDDTLVDAGSPRYSAVFSETPNSLVDDSDAELCPNALICGEKDGDLREVGVSDCRDILSDNDLILDDL